MMLIGSAVARTRCFGGIVRPPLPSLVAEWRDGKAHGVSLKNNRDRYVDSVAWPAAFQVAF